MKRNPKKFLASHETVVFSIRGDTQTLAKSLIMAVEDIANDWYTSLKPLSILSSQQLKIELLSTFQGYHSGVKTTRDLLNCIQRDNEPLSDYLERFIWIKAQVPNSPDKIVIAAAIDGLAIGPRFAKN